MSRPQPVWLHLTSFAFGASSHPGVFRCVEGLAPHAQNVVLHWGGARYAEAQADEAAGAGVHVHALPNSKLLKKPFAVAHLLAGVRRRYGRPAAVIAHFGNNGWRGLPLAAWAECPIATLFHGEDAARRVSSEAYETQYQRLFQAPAARFLAVAQHLADSLVRAGAPADAVSVHHLGVPIPAGVAEPRDPEPGRLRVALVGRLLAVKGHPLAFEAVGRARSQGADVELHCFGDGPDAARLQALQADSPAREKIHLHGGIPAAALQAELRRMDAVIQPSVRDPDGRAEGLPNALLEAMALALPAIGTRHGGIPEAIVDGETGLLVKEDDAQGLADALLHLARDPAEARRMGAAGRKRVEAEFSLEGQGARLAESLRVMCAAYQSLSASTLRKRWSSSLEGLAEPRSRTGRREQIRWAARIARNRLAGAVP